MQLFRKFISSCVKINRKICNYIRLIKIKTLNQDINIGQNLIVGRNSQISASDGGEIIIGNNVSIGCDVHIVAKYGSITIKNNVFIGRGVTIVARTNIKIGNDTQIAEFTTIRDQNHRLGNDLIRLSGYEVEEIDIGNDVWIGAKSTITKGSIVADKAIIGANSVVTKNIKYASINGGVPSKYLKMRELTA